MYLEIMHMNHSSTHRIKIYMYTTYIGHSLRALACVRSLFHVHLHVYINLHVQVHAHITYFSHMHCVYTRCTLAHKQQWRNNRKLAHICTRVCVYHTDLNEPDVQPHIEQNPNSNCSDHRHLSAAARLTHADRPSQTSSGASVALVCQRASIDAFFGVWSSIDLQHH